MLTAGPAGPGQQQPPLPITEHHQVRTRHCHEHVVPDHRGEPLPTRGASSEIMGAVPAPPDSTKRSLRYRLITRTCERWPQLADLTIRHRGQFTYIDGELTDGTTLPLFRL